MRKISPLDALFSKTRQNVLATLLLSPDRRWYMSDLAKHLGVTPSSLQRELASLTEAGLSRRETDGNRVYYQAAADSPLFRDLQSLFAKTTGIAEEVKQMLKPYLAEVDVAFIFGSVARGERTASSDLDLLIAGKIGLPDLALPLRDLEAKLHIAVNVVHFTMDEFLGKLRLNNHFLRTILQDQKIFLKGSEDELAILVVGSTAKDTHHQPKGVG